jgi:hypothetical protein
MYKSMGVQPGAHIHMGLRYGGIRGRTLASASPRRLLFEKRRNVYEDEVSTPMIRFTLESIESDIVHLVKVFCNPLFVLFDFEEFDDGVYVQLVTDFVSGRVT